MCCDRISYGLKFTEAFLLPLLGDKTAHLKNNYSPYSLSSIPIITTVGLIRNDFPYFLDIKSRKSKNI